MRFLIGIIGFIIGLLLVIRVWDIRRIFGISTWGEEWFGREGKFLPAMGGTYFFYQLLGLLLIIGSLLFMTGLLQEIFRVVLGPFFGIK